MANLCKPITAYDFQVRHNNTECHTLERDLINTSDHLLVNMVLDISLLKCHINITL